MTRHQSVGAITTSILGPIPIIGIIVTKSCKPIGFFFKVKNSELWARNYLAIKN